MLSMLLGAREKWTVVVWPGEANYVMSRHLPSIYPKLCSISKTCGAEHCTFTIYVMVIF
jgi:hypothetical protein